VCHVIRGHRDEEETVPDGRMERGERREGTFVRRREQGETFVR
jgi:hypothetical protein